MKYNQQELVFHPAQWAESCLNRDHGYTLRSKLQIIWWVLFSSRRSDASFNGSFIIRVVPYFYLPNLFPLGPDSSWIVTGAKGVWDRKNHMSTLAHQRQGGAEAKGFLHILGYPNKYWSPWNPTVTTWLMISSNEWTVCPWEQQGMWCPGVCQHSILHRQKEETVSLGSASPQVLCTVLDNIIHYNVPKGAQQRCQRD